MTINFDSEGVFIQTFKLYYVPSELVNLKFILKSKYSNKDLLKEKNISSTLNNINIYEGWSIISFNINDTENKLSSEDISGYYEFQLLENNVVTFKCLAKVNNLREINTEYISNNEENKQFIYYRP